MAGEGIGRRIPIREAIDQIAEQLEPVARRAGFEVGHRDAAAGRGAAEIGMEGEEVLAAPQGDGGDRAEEIEGDAVVAGAGVDGHHVAAKGVDNVVAVAAEQSRVVQKGVAGKGEIVGSAAAVEQHLRRRRQAAAVDVQAVPAVAAEHAVVAGAAELVVVEHDVVARAAVKGVAAGAAVELVEVVAALQPVVAAAAGQDVVALAADQGVGAEAAFERVVAGAAGEGVGDLVAGQAIVAGAAGRILDQRAAVVHILQGVGDVAVGEMAVAQIGELRGGGLRPQAGIEIDGDAGRVAGQIIGIDAAAVPDCHEDLVCAGGVLVDAVDRHLSRQRVPLVDAVVAVHPEIRAIQILERGDVVHHEGLGVAELLVGVAGIGVHAGIGTVAHHRIVHIVVRGGHRAEDIGLVRMLQAERVADLVQEAHIGVVAAHRSVEFAARIVEPDVAGQFVVMGRVGVGDLGVVGHAEAQLRLFRRLVEGRRTPEDEHGQVFDIIEDRDDNPLLRSVQLLEADIGLGIVRIAGELVGVARKAEIEEGARAPPVFGHQTGNILIARPGIGDDVRHDIPLGAMRWRAQIALREGSAASAVKLHICND